MPDDALGWQIANWVWDRSDEIGRKLAAVYRWFRGRGTPDERGILVIGPGGTGKTTLARILSGEFDWLRDDPWRYDESRQTERYALADDLRVEVTVPPGQAHRRDTTWPELLAEVGAGKYRGVVFVAAYGYHNPTTESYKSDPLYAGNKDEFVRRHTERQRAEELDIVRRLAAEMPVPRTKLWFLTVVAKQDLWAPALREVERHYLAGDYADAVRALAARAGVANFRPEVVLASLVISNLDTRHGERIKANEAGYDHRQQVASVRRLIEVISALKDWEAES